VHRGLLLLGAVLVLAGCGTGGLATGAGDQDNGRKLFVSKCGGCHTLAAAGTSGTVGPNLDDSFAQARADGFKESSIEDIVLDQIRIPGQYATGNASNELQANMPANLVTGQDAQDVAAFVAANAGKEGFSESQQLASNDGKTIFKAKCGSCHTLADAGTTGETGPNLDKFLKGKDAKFIQQSIEDPSAFVEKGFQDGIMPPNYKETLQPEEIKALTDYLVKVASK
jgi:cbb3-type cytochrome c oxidase subunit III